MKKLLNVVLFILVILICLVIIVFLPNYDEFLSTKVFTPPKEEVKDAPVLFADCNFSEGNDVHPVFSVVNGNIQMMYKGEFVDLLPSGYSVNSDAPAKIFEVLLREGNFRLSADGSRAAYLLTFNKINILFLCDFETKTAMKIDEKVDSFAIAPDGSYIVYATGYVYSNTVFVYKAGETRYVAENVSAFYESEFGQIALKNQDKTCSIYSVEEGVHRILADGVTELCLPTQEGKYNYTAMHDTFSLFFKKGETVYSFVASRSDGASVTGGVLTELSCPFEQAVPYEVFRSVDSTYKYFDLTGKLVRETNEGDDVILSDVKCVYTFDGYSKFVYATGTGLSVFNATDGSTVRLTEFKARYKNSRDLIENHITVVTEDFRNFYVCLLNDTSFIVKKSNPASWLNRFSKYRYSLEMYSLSGDTVVKNGQSFPSSDELFEAIVSSDLVYFPVKTDGTCIVKKFDGNSVMDCLEGDIRLMKNETGVYCAKFEGETVKIFCISRATDDVSGEAEG